MNNEEIYLTKTSEETKKLAQNIAKTIKSGVFLAFYGNLGSGKTTFIQGLAEGLGIKRRFISPTFIIVRHYVIQIKNQKPKIKITTQNLQSFYHIDLYRMDNVDDLLGIGLDEIIEDKNNIVAVEWAEKLGDMLPKKRIEFYFKYIDENSREIRIKNYE